MSDTLPHRTSLTIPDELRQQAAYLPASFHAATTSEKLRRLLTRGIAAELADAEVAAYNEAYAEMGSTPDVRARRSRVHGAAERALDTDEVGGA